MKIKNRKIKVLLEFEVPTYISDDSTIVELSDKNLIKHIKEAGNCLIKTELISKKEDCKILDRKFDFMKFVPNCINLIYDENNKDTYKHFVFHYLKNYYVDSFNSDHFNNGGYWEHSNYNIESKLHNQILNNKFDLSDPLSIGVRDLILIHLLSGSGVRMYGTGQRYRRVRTLNTLKEQKEFWKWVFDSKMLDLNGPIIMSDRIKQVINNKKASSLAHEYKYWFEDYKSVAELVILKCWRDGSLEVLKWISEKYKLDLYKVDKMYNVKADVDFSKSFLCRIISEIHDERIHNTYNNGVLSRLYDYTTKKLKPLKERDKLWANESFNKLIDFINWIKCNYPLLILSESSNHSCDKNIIIIYDNLEDWMRKVLLKRNLDSSYEGEIESAELLISKINK